MNNHGSGDMTSSARGLRREPADGLLSGSAYERDGRAPRRGVAPSARPPRKRGGVAELLRARAAIPTGGG